MRFGTSARRVSVSATSAAAGAGYDLAARIAMLRADAVTGSGWSSTSDSFAPNGLQLPTAPSGLSPVGVSSLANLQTEINSGNGKEITLAPGSYTAPSGSIFTVPNGVSNCRIIVKDCPTLNVTGNNHSFITGWRTSQIEIDIRNSVLNAIPEILGTDIKVLANGASSIGDGNSTNLNANGSGLGWYGHRICVEGGTWRGYYGLAFVGTMQGADFVGDISGTTLTISTVYEGTIRIGQSLLNNGGTAFMGGTKIVSGSGTSWIVNISQVRASARASAMERSTNCIFANCDLQVPKSTDQTLVENPLRFNGGHFCLALDYRSYEEANSKHTGRSHADVQNEYSGSMHGYINGQHENQGFFGNGFQAGVYPYCDHLVLDNLNFYCPQSAGYATGIGLDADATFNLVGLSGNGTTVTATVFALNGHYLPSSTSVTITPATGLGIPSGFGGTYSITSTGLLTFTYPCTQTGTYGGTQNDYVGYASTSAYRGFTLVTMRNVRNYAAPAGGTNGTGLLPVGSGIPYASWPTCSSAAVSLSNGNEWRTYVSTPAWSAYTSTPSLV